MMKGSIIRITPTVQPVFTDSLDFVNSRLYLNTNFKYHNIQHKYEMILK